jgi:hypothetical protein
MNTKVGFEQYDFNRGLAQSAAEHTNHYMTQEMHSNERRVALNMAKFAQANGKFVVQDLMAAAVTPDQASDIVVAACDKMRKTQSKKQSIDFVPKEIVRGQMRSEV